MTRLLDFCGLMLIGVAFAASLVVAATFESNLPLAVIAAAFAGLCAFGAYKINQRVKIDSVPPPIKLPADFRTLLTVYRTKGRLLLFVTGVVIFGAPAYLLFELEPIVAILAGLVAVCLILVIAWELRTAGTPALIIDERGITTPNFGSIPWSEIHRVAVRVGEVRGMKIYWLVLSVYEPTKYFARLNAFNRWLKRLDVSAARDLIQIPLSFLGHKPSYIEAAITHVRAKYGAPKAFDMRR